MLTTVEVRGGVALLECVFDSFVSFQPREVYLAAGHCVGEPVGLVAFQAEALRNHAILYSHSDADFKGLDDSVDN